MTYLLVLCLSCAAGGVTVTIPRPDALVCEADAARFLRHAGAIAECVEQPDPREAELRRSIEGYCRQVVAWKPPASPLYADLPRTMAECMARLTPKTATE